MKLGWMVKRAANRSHGSGFTSKGSFDVNEKIVGLSVIRCLTCKI